MPIHDWTRVSDGTFHDFHIAWIAEIRNVLNGGLLPPGYYYAQAEQIVNRHQGEMHHELFGILRPTANAARPVVAAALRRVDCHVGCFLCTSC
jgi:hypothetical protein